MEVSAQRIESVRGSDGQQLEADGELEREVEFLPSTEEMLERRAAGVGHDAAGARRAARLREADDRGVAPGLGPARLAVPRARPAQRYFPREIVERFGHLIAEHPLRRELIATIVSNDVVNSQGITFVSRMVTETGARAAEVVRAFRIARDVTGAVERWADVEALDGLIDPGVQNELMTGVDWLVETTSRWYLVHATGQRLADAIGESRQSFDELSEVIDQIGPEAWREEHEHAARRLVAEGVPPEIAKRHAFQAELVHGPDIIRSRTATGRSVLEIARGFFLLGERLQIDWLETQLEGMAAGTRWQRWAQQSMEDDLFNLRRQVAEKVLESLGRPADRRGGRDVPHGAARCRRTAAPLHAAARDGGRHRPRPADRGASADPGARRLGTRPGPGRHAAGRRAIRRRSGCPRRSRRS